MTTTRSSSIAPAVAMLMIVVAGLTPGSAQQSPSRVTPDAYRELKWRFIGPEGNRVSAVVGVPGEPLVYYAGSASGGTTLSAENIYVLEKGREVGAKVAEEILKRRERPLWTQRRAINTEENRVI